MDNFFTEWIADDEMLEEAVLELFGAANPVEGAAVRFGGSHAGRSTNVNRRRNYYSQLLQSDYWGPAPLLNEDQFRANFKVPKALFDLIVNGATAHDAYFTQKPDAAGRLGATPHQKICAALRMLTSGVAAQELDDKYRMGGSTILEFLKRICVALDEMFGETALRAPTDDDGWRSSGRRQLCRHHGCN